MLRRWQKCDCVNDGDFIDWRRYELNYLEIVDLQLINRRDFCGEPTHFCICLPTANVYALQMKPDQLHACFLCWRLTIDSRNVVTQAQNWFCWIFRRYAARKRQRYYWMNRFFAFSPFLVFLLFFLLLFWSFFFPALTFVRRYLSFCLHFSN